MPRRPAQPPTVFIYPLPPELTMVHLYDNVSSGSHEAQFLGELRIWRWLERYPHRADAATADVLFVPAMLVAAYFALHRTDAGRQRLRALGGAIETFLQATPEWHTRRSAHAIVALRCAEEGGARNALRAAEQAHGAWPRCSSRG